MGDLKSKGVSRLYLDGLILVTLLIPAFLLTLQTWFMLTFEWQWQHVLMIKATAFSAGLQFSFIGGILLLLGFWYVLFWCLLMRDVCRELVPNGKWNLKPNSVWTAFIPVIGIIAAIRILLELSWRKSAGTFAILVIHLFAVAAVPAIFLTVQLHKINLNLILLLMIIAIGAAICNYVMLAGKRPSKLGYILIWPPLIVILLNFAFAYYAIYSIDRKSEQTDAVLSAMGIPTSREKAKEFYYQGQSPDQDFMNLVGHEFTPGKQLFPESFAKLEKIQKYDYRTYTEEDRKQRQEFIASSAEFFAAIDKLGEKDKPLKGTRNYNQPLWNILLPELNFVRNVARLYSLRITEATDAKDRAETMRLFKLSSKILSNTRDDSFLIGGLVSIVCERIMLSYLEYMLASSILNDSDLKEIDTILKRKEGDLKIYSQRTFFTEAYFFLTTFDSYMNAEFNDDTDFILNPHLKNILGAPFYYLLKNDRINAGNYFLHNLKVIAEPKEYHLKKDFSSPFSNHNEFKKKFPFGILSGMLLPALKGCYEKFISLEAELRMAQIAVKIEKFKLKNNGRLPETLAQLSADLPRDPFNGNEFKYEHGRIMVLIGESKKKEEVSGYRLYGTGSELVIFRSQL